MLQGFAGASKNRNINGSMSTLNLIGGNDVESGITPDLLVSGGARIRKKLYANSIQIKNNFILPPNDGSLDYSEPGSVAYNTVNEQLQISDGLGWHNIPATPIGSRLVFRPNYTGSNVSGIYGSWQELYNDLIKIDGSRYIQFDNSLIPNNVPIVIPPGIWDMTDTTWFGPLCSLLPPPDLFVKINISDGATINGLCSIDGLLTVTYFGTTQAAITVNQLPSDKHVNLIITNGASINLGGTQPFLELQSGFYEIVLLFSGQLNGSGVVSIASGTQFIVAMGTYSSLSDNSLVGSGTYLVIRLAPGALVTIPLVQPGVTGSISVGSAYSSPDTYSRSVAPTSTDDANIGYKIGDIWVNTATNDIYMAANVTPSSAVWKGPI